MGPATRRASNSPLRTNPKIAFFFSFARITPMMLKIKLKGAPIMKRNPPRAPWLLPPQPGFPKADKTNPPRAAIPRYLPNRPALSGGTCGGSNRLFSSSFMNVSGFGAKDRRWGNESRGNRLLNVQKILESVAEQGVGKGQNEER